MNRKHILAFLFLAIAIGVHAQQTERQYLSGTGLGHTVTWQFYCSEGRNSGKWDKIEVPSQWELQGFGEYTYGRWYKTKGVKNPSMEQGIYRRSFKIPSSWRDKEIRLWFDGVMTDTEVFINGQSAGEIHRGGFYRFSYDVTSLLKFTGNNKIEVHVKKHSDNKSVNAAERKADWWLFGGIYRPVWLEAKPTTHIEHQIVDAQANGDMRIKVYFQGTNGKEKLSAILSTIGNPSQVLGKQELCKNSDNLFTCHWYNIEPWTPETPQLYNLTLSLLNEQDKVVHKTNLRIGFRTINFRPKDGIYLNGVKLIMKGINRHSFHPEGGRTTNKGISIQDALLIKEMNMNAVRSHYPPDKHFLDVCDSLGLLYTDELAGWQNVYDTETGKKLLKEMVTRDVNHPCIILWSNGNEGGWNTSLDSLFQTYDLQSRHVIHPWSDFNEVDTHHYPAYLTGVGRFTNGYKIFMPTEFMHGQYDQGHGAGLEDFWTRYTAHPLFAGGFMWAYSDETVRRADKNWAMDSDGYNAPDGIVGPYREREASFYSVREIWSPIQIKPFMITSSFQGKFLVTNSYLFTNLKECSMRWRIHRCPSPLQNEISASVIDSGLVCLPELSPGETGFAQMSLSNYFFEGDLLELEAYDKSKKSICTRTFPVQSTENYLQRELKHQKITQDGCWIENMDSLIILHSSTLSVSFRSKDATILTIQKTNGQVVPLKNGPLPVGMKMRLNSLVARKESGGDAVLCSRYKGGADSIVWRLKPNGILFMDAVLLNRASGGGGFDDAFTDEAVLNFGLTFSYPESKCTGIRWLGRGPYRVWKNRIPGTNYGIWQKDYNNTITGESMAPGIQGKGMETGRLIYPEFKGYHANLYWVTIQNAKAPFTVYSATNGVFLRVFTPEEPRGRQDNLPTMPEFPVGDLSFLLDIPAIRSFKPISQHGPQSQPGIIRIKKGDEGLKLKLLFDFR